MMASLLDLVQVHVTSDGDVHVVLQQQFLELGREGRRAVRRAVEGLVEGHHHPGHPGSVGVGSCERSLREGPLLAALSQGMLGTKRDLTDRQTVQYIYLKELG